MSLDEKDRTHLEDFVLRMKGYRARHTELISVLVPAGFDINLITKQLESEKSTAANIKSTSTRKNVQDALESLVRITKSMKQAPKNGLGLFAGNVSVVEGQDNFIVEVFEPPEELNLRLYRCDQTFVLDPFDDMLEEKEVYGLIVIERNEATLGLLIGKKIKVLQNFESYIPGKTNKGGQCLSPDTLIMKDSGEIIEIQESHNPLFVVSENFNSESSEVTPVIAKWNNDKQLFKIITKCPRLEIKASNDHLFFVRSENGIEEKPLSMIKPGDFLVMSGKIDINGIMQNIDFKYEKIKKTKDVEFPNVLDRDLAMVLGYYLGDGNHEPSRISFSEQNEDVAIYYGSLIERLFKISCKMRFRESKNYYQLRVHNLYISQFFKHFFPKTNKTLEQDIPEIFLKSTNDVLASFIRGFFDAEGYVSKTRVGLGINNKRIIQQLQLCFLRFGILSSIHEYDNRINPYSDNIRYTIEISSLDSLKKFNSFIGFTSEEKKNMLLDLINNRGNQDNINQLVINGKDVARIILNSGMKLNGFGCPMFFNNKRQMSRRVFENKILSKVVDSDLKKRLEFVYNSNLVPVKINKIISLEKSKTIDIETKSHNFIANGLIVHNSAARYSRIRDGLAKEFYRKIATVAKEEFFELKGLKGILVGGPGPTKEDFLKEGQLVTELYDKVIAVKDIGYADEHGLDLLVESSDEELQNLEVVRERKLLENFFNMLGKERDKTAYGEEEVNKALEYGAVEKLFISKKFDKEKVQVLEKKAEQTGVTIEIISVDTEGGQQFWNIGGVGAILRYKIG